MLDNTKYIITLNEDGTATSEYDEVVESKWVITETGVKLKEGTEEVETEE